MSPIRKCSREVHDPYSRWSEAFPDVGQGQTPVALLPADLASRFPDVFPWSHAKGQPCSLNSYSWRGWVGPGSGTGYYFEVVSPGPTGYTYSISTTVSRVTFQGPTSRPYSGMPVYIYFAASANSSALLRNGAYPAMVFRRPITRTPLPSRLPSPRRPPMLPPAARHLVYEAPSKRLLVGPCRIFKLDAARLGTRHFSRHRNVRLLGGRVHTGQGGCDRGHEVREQK